MQSILKLLVVCAIVKISSSFPAEKKLSAMSSLDLTRYGPNVYNSPDKLAGKNLKEWTKSKGKGNPEEQGNYFEGDIIIDVEARNGVILTSQKWPGAKIPYEIRGSFTQAQKNLISDAIEQFKNNTCIKFMPRAAERDYIVFDNSPTGCWSPVGKTGGAQIVNLQTPGCMMRVGTVMHEILHSTGFFHEQNRFDRDDYVKVNFHNIEDDKFINFEKISADEISSFGVDYDVDSVLHYSPYAFSKNNLMTIQTLYGPKLNDRMGQREGFSKGDIQKIKQMYCV